MGEAIEMVTLITYNTHGSYPFHYLYVNRAIYCEWSFATFYVVVFKRYPPVQHLEMILFGNKSYANTT